MDSPDALETSTVNLAWRLLPGTDRPVVEVSKLDGSLVAVADARSTVGNPQMDRKSLAVPLGM